MTSSGKFIFWQLFILDRFFYIYIYYWKVNAECNKLIKTVGHYAHFFEK